MRGGRGRRGAALFAAGVLVMAAAGTGPAHAAASTAGTVYVSTVPAVAGLRIDVGGQVRTTGPDGSVSAQVGNLNGIASRVSLDGSKTPNGDAVSMARIVAGRHVPHESHLSMGLSITSQVRLQLLPGVTGVAPETVHQLRLHSVAGQRITVDPQRHPFVSLLARRAQLQHGELTSQTVTWSVDRVAVVPGISVTTAHAAFDPLDHHVWQLSLQPVHGNVVITTVPAVGGAVFVLDGATVTTDRNGKATAPVDDLNGVSDRLSLATPDADGGLEVSNMRVNKQPPLVPHQRRLLVALDVRRPVLLRFVDLRGNRVPSSRVTDLSASAGSGLVRVVGQELAAPISLLARQATKVGSDWQTRDITYTLRSVRLEGGQAVFNGRQRFASSSGDIWTIKLAVFTLTVTAHDAFFGSQLATHLVITRPDGTEVPMQLSSSVSRTTPSMVRGMYSVQIDSAVLAGRENVLISRNERIDLRVVTLWDAVAVLLLILAILVAAVLGGRRMARRRERRRAR